MITKLRPLLLFLVAISQSRFEITCAPRDKTSCSSFRLLVIWHTSNGEDIAFIEQKRLIMQSIINIPQGTEVLVTAINTKLKHILHFKKNTTIDWIYKISMYSPAYLDNYSIQGFLIKTLVSNFSEHNSKKEVANKLLLVVSEKTLIQKRSLEKIENVTRLVVFTGWNPPPPLWKSVATDRHHLVTLNTTYENLKSNINGAAKKVKDILCQESRLTVDTDELLAGERCINCSYICSEDTKTHPVKCRELCPDYKRLPPKKTANEADKTATNENIKPEIVWKSISIFLFALFCLSAILKVALSLRKRGNCPVYCYRTEHFLFQETNRPSINLQKVLLSEKAKCEVTSETLKTETSVQRENVNRTLHQCIKFYYMATPSFHCEGRPKVPSLFQSGLDIWVEPPTFRKHSYFYKGTVTVTLVTKEVAVTK